jgi:hypothetical protein
MKKIIKGKLYDTDTAQRLGWWDNGLAAMDFSYCEEYLFVKKTGEYFLYGTGGPMSKYSQPINDNNWSGSEMIIPLSYDAARDWAETHLREDEYQAIFGEVSEDAGRVALNLSLPGHVAALLRQRASEAGVTVSQYVASLVK